MSMPWDTFTAQDMQPDSPIPAVATNTDGVRVGVDIGPPLRTAIDQAIKDAVTEHPVLGRAVKTVVRDSDRADRTLMQSSVLDLTVATVAALFTVISPDSPTTGVLWLTAAVLASRTMVQAAVHRLVPA
jgi:hypothetical protein